MIDVREGSVKSDHTLNTVLYTKIYYTQKNITIIVIAL